MLEEVTQAKGNWKIIQWSNISVNVVKSFLRYLYGGFMELELETLEEWYQAKEIGLKYELELWQNFVESIRHEFDQTIFM